MSDQANADINEFYENLYGPDKVVEDNVEPEESEEAPAGEEVATEDEASGTSKIDEPAAESEGGAKEDEPDPLEAMRKALNEQAQENLKLAASQNVASTELAYEPPKEAGQVSTYEFVKSTEDIDELLADPKKMNAMLNQIFTAAANAGRVTAVKEMTRSLPAIMENSLNQSLKVREAGQNFYKKNPDLEPYKELVVLTAQTLAKKNPQMELDEMYLQTADTVRKNLGLAANIRQRKPATPAGARAGGAGVDRTKQPRKKDLADPSVQISDFLDNLRN